MAPLAVVHVSRVGIDRWLPMKTKTSVHLQPSRGCSDSGGCLSDYVIRRRRSRD
ncbi:TPA: hypothetical protein N0F65_000230 [Lagenidium giganteum]|uniref:Uncharacterized protein n=1 Tax=Lagenidium giganteum TaxID=4803 RepID=A0AAV2YDY5_9STRA|nr:TPA: hypothetical protein N0F65_000230 [Lagenidium giganteum]